MQLQKNIWEAVKTGVILTGLFGLARADADSQRGEWQRQQAARASSSAETAK